MKNFIVASVLGRTRQNQAGAPDDRETQNRVGVNKGQPVNKPTNVGRRTDVTTSKELRPRGKSCDRMMQNQRQSENRHLYGGEWNDDGGFGQWRAIHHHQPHQPSSSARPETHYHHHARPVSVSITDRIQLVLQQDRQQKQQQIDDALHLAANHQRFQQQPFNGNIHQFYPEYHPYPSMSGTTMGSWAYQSGSSSEEAVGPQSLDSQWAVQRQHNNHLGVNHPSMAQPSSLSRKLSTYGTLPRNRQRFFTAKFQSK